MKNFPMKNLFCYVLQAICLGMLTLPLSAQAFAFEGLGKEQGDWLIRGRIIGVLPEEGTNVPALGGDADASDEYVPELDISYFVTDNIAVELILATAKHQMSLEGSSAGDVDLGEVWLLPPTLTVQYHFDPGLPGAMTPYIGGGLNYSLFYNEEGAPGSAASATDYENAVGYVFQAGLDIPAGQNWYMNLDLKKIWVNTDITVDLAAGGSVTGDVDLDPWILGLGVGYKF